MVRSVLLSIAAIAFSTSPVLAADASKLASRSESLGIRRIVNEAQS